MPVLLDYVLEATRLIEHGMLVLPLAAHGVPYSNCHDCRENHTTAELRQECPCLFCHAVYAARSDTRAWEERPSSLIGIRCGAAPFGSGVVVLDFDEHRADEPGLELLAAMESRGELPPTVRALSGGGGVHLYYRHPGEYLFVKSEKNRLGPGGDVRGDLGFVVAPPSRKNGASEGYRWQPGSAPWETEMRELPEELLVALSRGTLERENEREYRTLEEDDADLVFRRYNRALTNLSNQPIDPWGRGRNDLTYVAACRGGDCVALGLLEEHEVSLSVSKRAAGVGLDAWEYGKTIRSGLLTARVQAAKPSYLRMRSDQVKSA